MKIGIATKDEAQKLELRSRKISENVVVQWVESTEELTGVKDADYWIDCTFSGSEIPDFEKPTLVHAPWLTLSGRAHTSHIVRFCAWSTFLSREVWEISATENSNNRWAEELLTWLGRTYVWVKDDLGLIAPRVVSSIINEAYYALQAGISSAAEIDLAMKLGTNYPYGPLEWCQRIGWEQVYRLLQVLSEKNKLYKPAFEVN